MDNTFIFAVGLAVGAVFGGLLAWFFHRLVTTMQITDTERLDFLADNAVSLHTNGGQWAVVGNFPTRTLSPLSDNPRDAVDSLIWNRELMNDG